MLAKFFVNEDTIGLGEAPNDIGFLLAVRTAVIIPSPYLELMTAALPAALIAPEMGPAGWNRAVLGLLRRRRYLAEELGEYEIVSKVPGR